MSFVDALHEILNDKLLLYVGVPLFLVLLVIEYVVDRKRKLGLYENKDMITSIAMGLFSLIVEFIPKVLFFMAFFYIYKANVFGLNEFMDRSHWWSWVILLFADDFAYYWFHRMNHEVRLFWAGHISHHSSVHLNFGTALRQGVGERLHKFFFWLWIPMLGFDPVMMFTMMSINLIYQYFTHTEFIRRMPSWYEAVFNTASHHRVHHASQARYLDRNHAGVFIIWDKIFGSFTPELDSDKPKYGLTKNIESNNWIYVATHEYSAIWRDVKRADKLMDKLKYIFYSPGWSHDGPDLRAKTLRNQVRD
ncbi:MAG: sterol desaturase family protein [Bacteroidetes bacterium]|nr:sterol desaturase family protein [Bacteroidota bacterium]